MALQSDVMFRITLLPHPLYMDGVTIGGPIGAEGQEDTYESANVTIVDDDGRLCPPSPACISAALLVS